MSIKIAKENICINQIIGQKEEIIIVEGDEIVPDIKPDVLSIISTNGTVCIYKKEIQDGKIHIEGSIYIYILYIADDVQSNIRSLNTSLNFSKTIDIENIKTDMQFENICEVKNIECKILNGRKISLQATIKIKLNVYSNENIELIKDIEDIQNIQKLDQKYKINSLVGSGSSKVYAKDTVKIDNIDNLMEIIKTQINIINKETKISYNKILAKADANVKIMYLTEDNRINTVVTQIPIMGFIDIPEISENNICDVSYELKNILIKPNNIEEHSIYVETEIEINCFAYANRDIKLIQDLYSPNVELEYDEENVLIMQDKRKIKEVCNIRKQEIIPEIGQNKILDVEIKINIINQQILNGRITYEGELNLNFLYATGESLGVNSKVITQPFNFNIADEKINSKTQISTEIEITMQDFIVMPDRSIDIKIDLEFNVNVSNMDKLNIINDIKIIENREKEKCSIVIYYTKKGDTLWKIAKRFGSIIEEIVKVNNIENPDYIMPGEQLFIPR